MAMTNRPNGGAVVLGVREQESHVHFDGLVPSDLATWIPDHLSDRLFKYADPPIAFRLSIAEYNDRSFVVLEIHPVDDMPVICKKSYPDVLQEGAIYVRPRRKPESVPIPTSADMRDLMELATERRAQRLLATAERIGLVPAAAPDRLPDSASYRAEANDLLGWGS